MLARDELSRDELSTSDNDQGRFEQLHLINFLLVRTLRGLLALLALKNFWHSKSDRGRSCSIQQQLRLFRMDTMDVDCHPCASKQEQIVKFACGEQGLGRAGERAKRSSW